MFDEIPVLTLYLVLAFAWFYILLYAIVQYRLSKATHLLIRTVYLIIALLSFRFFSVYALHALQNVMDQALLERELVALLRPFSHPMLYEFIDMAVTSAILGIIVFGSIGRQRLQLQS